jgi:hypothetical protein
MCHTARFNRVVPLDMAHAAPRAYSHSNKQNQAIAKAPPHRATAKTSSHLKKSFLDLTSILSDFKLQI